MKTRIEDLCNPVIWDRNSKNLSDDFSAFGEIGWTQEVWNNGSVDKKAIYFADKPIVIEIHYDTSFTFVWFNPFAWSGREQYDIAPFVREMQMELNKNTSGHIWIIDSFNCDRALLRCYETK